MRILIFSPRQSWPTNTGAKLREFCLARELARHADLTLLAFDPAHEQPPAAALGFYRSVIRIPAPERYTPAKLIRGLLGSTPLPVLNYTTGAMRSALAGTLRSGSFDLVQFEATALAGYTDVLQAVERPPLMVYDWHNIESELMFRYSAGEPSPAKRLYASITARKLASTERRLLKTADGHLVCSVREQKQLQQIAPAARIAVVPNGVDVDYFSDAEIEKTSASGGPSRIVFTGSMDYHANVEAVIYFVNQLWPALRDIVPETVFTIVGSNPRPEVRALAGDRVEVTGTVPDVRCYYRNALAVVVPIRTGSGTRLKVCEALAAGRPVVSTAVGAEGISITNRRDILLAETVEEWQQAFRLLRDNAGLRQGLIDSGRELVHAQYDWKGLGTSLYRQYAQWLDRK